MDPFILSAGAKVLGSLFGRRDEGRQARENTDRANRLSREAADLAWERNQAAASGADKRNHRNAIWAERQSDLNAHQAREFNAAQADKANAFTKAQNDLAYERSEVRDLRNREWAKADYAQQKGDLANQFVDLRAAAKKGGFNPLAVLGTQMTPSLAAGGLSSSSYGAGSGVGASAGFSAVAPVSASVPMAYGAEVSVQPVVSNAAILGEVAELGREFTGENAVQRQTQELQRDLMRIELDTLRSGVFPSAPSGALPSMGSAAVPVASLSSSVGGGRNQRSEATNWSNEDMPRPWRYEEGESVVPTEVIPTPYSSGYGIVRVFGMDVPVPMDPSGEMLGVGQMPVLAMATGNAALKKVAGLVASGVQQVGEGVVTQFYPSLWPQTNVRGERMEGRMPIAENDPWIINAP